VLQEGCIGVAAIDGAPQLALGTGGLGIEILPQRGQVLGGPQGQARLACGLPIELEFFREALREV